MLLDTDVTIDLLRQRPEAREWILSLPQAPQITGVAALEVTFSARDTAELRRIRSFLEDFVIAWPTEEDAQQAEAFANIRLSHGIGILDCMAAASALRLGKPIATFNIRHFSAIPGLATVRPYVR
jgi:predicted nucleic acid-binding protein